jgi:hypothetical protein
VRDGLTRGKLDGVGRTVSGRDGVHEELVEVSHRCHGELTGQILEAGSLLREARVAVNSLLAVGASFLFERHLTGKGSGGGLGVYGRDECLGWSFFGLGAQLSGIDDIVNVARAICLLPGLAVGCPVSVDDKLEQKVVSRVHFVPQVEALTL